MRTTTVTLPEPVPDMGGWTVRNLPAHPELARSSGGRAHRETPLAGKASFTPPRMALSTSP